MDGTIEFDEDVQRVVQLVRPQFADRTLSSETLAMQAKSVDRCKLTKLYVTGSDGQLAH